MKDNKREARKAKKDDSRARLKTVEDDSWRISDALWARIKPLLPASRPHPLGCHNPAADARKVMDAIFFVLRTGCQWGALDRVGYCPHSTAHGWFQRWVQAGVFEKLWSEGLEVYNKKKGLDWSWQSMDGAMTKAPLGGEKNRPQSDRSSQGGRQAQRVVRKSWHSRGAGGGRSESQRYEDGSRNAGKRSGAAPRAHTPGAAKSLHGQGLRLRRGSRSDRGVWLYGPHSSAGRRSPSHSTASGVQSSPLGRGTNP